MPGWQPYCFTVAAVQSAAALCKTVSEILIESPNYDGISSAEYTVSPDPASYMYFSVRGWRPTTANIDKRAGSIAAMRISESDTVILDLCSNCAHMGTVAPSFGRLTYEKA